MSIVTWDDGKPRWKGSDDAPTRRDTKRAAVTEREQGWRETCAAVSVREGYCCRVCGHACDANSPSMLRRGHHHHIVFRSKGRDDSTGNVVLLCSKHHDDVHVKRSLVIEGNADGNLTFLKRLEDGTYYVWHMEGAPRD